MKIQRITDIDDIGRGQEGTLYVPEVMTVNTGMASCGIAAGADKTFARATDEFGDDRHLQIRRTGCLGFCEMEPLVEIYQRNGPRILYKNVTEDKIIHIIDGYREGQFDKKLILGQMRDPRSLLEEDTPNPLLGVEPVAGNSLPGRYPVL